MSRQTRRLLATTAAVAGLALARRLLATSRPLRDFRGRAVLVTGGSRGLGLEVARAFAHRGAEVMIAARDRHELVAARSLLADDGVALIHSIGRKGQPSVTQPFLAKYIFPGGYIPALSEVLPTVERSGLWATDLEILRLHYAETIREWRRRFAAQRAEVAKIYDERFCRMWEFYLATSEVAFRWFGFMNFQVQLSRKVDALPITRDYMVQPHYVGLKPSMAAE